MFPSNFDVDSRKRKLDYSRKKIYHDQKLTTKTNIFKNSNVTKTSKVSEWQRATEGFSGFTECDDSRPTKRRSLPARQPQKYRICMPCDSESEAELEVENTIKWSSSEDDLSPVSDKEENSRVIKKESKCQTTEKKKIKETDMPQQSKIDFENSDNESEAEGSLKFSCKISAQNEADLIEDADSRSSFTLSGSNTKSDKNSDIQDSIESIEIPTSTEASATSISPSQKTKVKASEWLKSLDMKTPTKQSPSPKVLLKEDSAKKKKKFTRNGLADQLYKLQIRERSAVRVWNHQTVTEEKVSSKSVVVKVLDYEMLYSLQLAKCQELIKTEGNSIGEEKEFYVLFTSEMAEEMKISIGTIVRICPPWQKLLLQSMDRSVLLCTNFIRVEGSVDVMQQNTESAKITMEWTCPCVTGLVKDYKQCPAYQFPCLPGIMLQCKDNRDNKSTHISGLQDHEQSLYMIQATQASTGTPTVSDSILESIDKSSKQTGVCFSAVVHRVLCKTVPNSSTKRYSLLVEDGHGIMCEIQMPDNSEHLYGEVIHNGEGSSYIFTGLKVLTRTTRDRDPALFSMIDSVWSGMTAIAVSEESEIASGSSISQRLPPGFCYSMVEHDDTDLKISEQAAVVTAFKTIQLVTLDDLKKNKGEICRFTMKVKLLAKLSNSDLSSSTSVDFRYLLYITDDSLDHTDYRIIKVKDTCHIQQPIGGTVVTKDVLYTNGNLICDCYSQILPNSYLPKLGFELSTEDMIHPFSPPDLDKDSKLYDLCTVKGIINEIDESSAYSWDVCDQCGLDKLAEKANTKELVCLGCKRVVKHPVTKMKMEIYASVTNFKSHRIKIDLLEDTIQLLLPEDENDDEGYDISSVLNSDVGPVTCVVMKMNNNDIFLKEIRKS
ncbi:SPIDR [Mytilus edulis]|uniref:SPIDR n=1 Tax=Mytilus edulis TaxID=6550 RepID=A0A8S3RAH6_MYTED|nr:SPIDR [Mytilus edulis]